MKKIFSGGLMLLLLIILNPLKAQILDRVLNRAINKAQQKLEDKAADIIAEQLTRYLEKQIDTYLSDIAREQAIQDSIDRANRGEKVSSAEVEARYRAILAGMNDASKVAENYSFNWRFDTEVEEGDKITRSAYLMSSSQPYFAIRQEEKEQVNFLVFDLQQDVVVMYSDYTDGRKTGQAMPGFIRIASHLAAQDSTLQSIKVKSGNKSKTIAGYGCRQYWGEGQEANFEWYATPDLENLWSDKYYTHLQRFSGQPHMEEWQKIKGMVLQSKFTDLDQKDRPVTWTVTAIDQKFNLSLAKKDYQFVGAEEKKQKEK